MTDWTEAAVERLKQLWPKATCSQISMVLGNEGYGSYSRNAVIGKVHRLGLVEKRKSYTEDSPTRYTAPRTRINSAPEGSTAYKVINGIRRAKNPPKMKPERFICRDTSAYRNIPLMELEHGDCRWPTTERLPHLFCGRRQTAGSSYCFEHFRMSVGEGTASERAANKLPKMVA